MHDPDHRWPTVFVSLQDRQDLERKLRWNRMRKETTWLDFMTFISGIWYTGLGTLDLYYKIEQKRWKYTYQTMDAEPPNSTSRGMNLNKAAFAKIKSSILNDPAGWQAFIWLVR